MKLFQNEPVVTKITAVLFVPAGGGTPVHPHRKAHGLAFNTDHSSTYRFSDGRVLTCRSGQCIYLPMGCSYTVDRSTPSEDPAAGVHAVNFLLDAPLADEPFLCSVRSQTAFLTAFRHAQTAWRQKQKGHREVCFSQLYLLLSMLEGEGSYLPASRTMERLEPALACIDRDFTGQLPSVAGLAALCSVSEPYLRRLFQSAFGMSPACYIRHKRLLYARELLDTGEYSVTQAAAAAGFNDAAYFSRAFKETFGASPASLLSGDSQPFGTGQVTCR